METGNFIQSTLELLHGQVVPARMLVLLRRAITDTHTGYFQIGVMTQDLIWEQVHDPVDLKTLLEANSDKLLLEANAADKLDPPSPPKDDVLINKTGVTNGFGAYVALVPKKKIGIVLLANKNYPISACVTAAYAILTRLDVNRNTGLLRAP